MQDDGKTKTTKGTISPDSNNMPLRLLAKRLNHKLEHTTMRAIHTVLFLSLSFAVWLPVHNRQTAKQLLISDD